VGPGADHGQREAAQNGENHRGSVSIVTPTPFMMAGKYRWISSHENASRKAEWNSLPAQRAISAMARVRSSGGEDLLGDLPPRSRHGQENHAVGHRAPPHLMAHHEHGHAAALELITLNTLPELGIEREVGSSNSISFVSASARAIATRCCPPESSAG
jgi:hypothetical protein